MAFLVYLLYLYLAFISLILVALVALNFVKSRARPFSIKSGYRPRTLVIVPCKGKDMSLEEGLKSLKEQDYKGRYDILAVVDSKDDPAVSSINRAGIKYILTNRLSKKGSGKVKAISTALAQFKDYDAYVIADSDIHCSKEWLKSLVEPLSDKNAGVSTAFPYFEPVKGSGFWTRVKMVWGFVGNRLLENERTRFAWGGSMAFRKGLLANGSYKKFSESLSDDIAVTKIAKKKSLRIYYVSDRIVKVPSKETFHSFAEWSNRQTALTLLGYKKNFAYGMAFYGANMVLLISGIILAIFYNALAVIFLIPFVIGAAKTYRRAGNADPAILPIFMIIDFIYMANLLTAKRKNTIRWRGIKYDLKQ